ncbi:MAG: phosphatase PAP2 family protein [Flavobacteriaceae bacterium]
MLEELIQLDRNLFLFLNNLGTESWDGFWMFLTDKWSAVPLYVLLLWLSYRQLGLRKTLVLLISIALLITCTDQIANFFKYGVKRLRPCYDEEFAGMMRLVKSYCGGRFAFFSAHASNSFAIAGFFALLFWKQIRIMSSILLVWALLVAYSRIYIGVHFPLDVIAGALVGLLFGWLFYTLFTFGVHKYSL